MNTIAKRTLLAVALFSAPAAYAYTELAPAHDCPCGASCCCGDQCRCTADACRCGSGDCGGCCKGGTCPTR